MRPGFFERPVTVGIRIAIVAQLLLVLSLVYVFYDRFVGQITFPGEGLSSEPAQKALLNMLPAVFVLAIVIFRFRWTPAIGSLVASGMTLQTEPFYLQAVLWALTTLGCIKTMYHDHDGLFSTYSDLWDSFFKSLFWKSMRPLMLLLVPLSLFAVPGFLFIHALSSSYGSSDYVGIAPNGSVAERRSWARKEMFDYFRLTDQWVRRSEVIASDLGEIISVAPIGSPNRFVAGGFTDGSHCRMNLEVVGDKGVGILYLPKVDVNNMHELYGISDQSTWKFKNKLTYMDLSGQSWWKKHGFDSINKQLGSFTDQGDHDSAAAAYKLLSEAMGDADALENSASQVKFYNGKQMFVSMPDKLRCETLLRFGNSLDATGHSQESLKPLTQVAEVCLRNFDRLTWHRLDPNNRVPRANEWLQIANVALKTAAKNAPNDELVLELAKERTIKQRRLNLGISVAQETVSQSDTEKRSAIVLELGEMFETAKYVANKSPWLQRELGEFRMRPSLTYGNQMYVNEKGYYAHSAVAVEIASSNGRSGYLTMRMSELESEVATLDLFSDSPRAPTRNYTFSRVSWYETGDDKPIHFRTKTLEPK